MSARARRAASSIRDLIPEGLSHGAGNDLEYEVGRLPPGQIEGIDARPEGDQGRPDRQPGRGRRRRGTLGEGRRRPSRSAARRSPCRGAVRRGVIWAARPCIPTRSSTNRSTTSRAWSLVETVPAGMEFAGASHGGQFNEGSRTIAWRIDRMSPGETRVVKSKLVPHETWGRRRARCASRFPTASRRRRRRKPWSKDSLPWASTWPAPTARSTWERKSRCASTRGTRGRSRRPTSS